MFKSIVYFLCILFFFINIGGNYMIENIYIFIVMVFIIIELFESNSKLK